MITNIGVFSGERKRKEIASLFGLIRSEICVACLLIITYTDKATAKMMVDFLNMNNDS